MKINPLILLWFVCLLSVDSLQAQEKSFEHKISPSIKPSSARELTKSIYIITLQNKIIPQAFSDIDPNWKLLGCYDSLCFYSLYCMFAEIREKLLPLPGLLFIEDGGRIPREEILISSLDISTNRINVVHDRYPAINGTGIITSLKENKPDSNDIDIRGRYLTSPLASAIVTDHASVMATMMAGGGNTWHLGKGAAWAAKISSSNFTNLLPDAAGYFQLFNISVQNHSYGVGIENYYGADAAAYDFALNTNQSLLHIFSSGNSGAVTPTTGKYAGLSGWSNLTGSFKMAKNILTVGATDSFGIVPALSSKGPAHDGRIKPELVAYGEDGSSGAAALVSGTVALLQHQYKQSSGTLPPNALLRAVLLNSADDNGAPGPDFTNGYGSLNALNAVKTFEAGRYKTGTVSSSGNQQFSITIPPGVRKIKVTLAWNDPAAAPNAVKALVNDLDLELKRTVSNETWQPWVLSSFPHADSLVKAAMRNRDTLNNAEQVSLDNPVAGNYDIVVKGAQLSSGSQPFFLAYQLDSADLFDWHYPTGTDFLFPSAPNLIRWDNSFATGTATLDYSINNGNTWQIISNSIDLSREYYKWDVPPYAGKALLRMTIGGRFFVSDTFTIAARTNLKVGFNCPDSFLLFWDRQTAASNYRVYELGSQYLQPITTTPDSFIVLGKSQHPSLFYAVAPLFQNKEAVKSYTINYSIQGVECYIRSFFARLVNNTAVMDLELGTLFNINKIILEKMVGNSFIPIQQLTSFNSLSVRFTDPDLSKGLNTYRIKLELSNGTFQYTLAETVYFFDTDKYIVYPNPVLQQQPVRIAASELNDALLQVYNATGMKIFEKILDDRVNNIPANVLGKGVYFIRIMQNNRREFSGKLVVL